jgi:hypothetical protein
MPGVLERRGSGGLEQVDQLGGRLDRRDGARLHDLAGVPGGELLLAVLEEDAAQRPLVVLGDDAGRGEGRRRVHPHVERGVPRVREPPVDAVELHRRHTEVVQDARDGGDAEIREHGRERIRHRVHEVRAPGERPQPLRRQAQRIRIPVDPDQGEFGEPPQEGLRVAAQAEGAVDHDGAGPLEGRCEQLEATLEQHGRVQGVVVGGVVRGIRHGRRGRSRDPIPIRCDLPPGK